MKVKVRTIIRTPKRVHVTLIKPPKPRIKPTELYDVETAQDFVLAEDSLFDTSSNETSAEDAEQSYVELFDEVEDMFDDAISDADEDAARFHIDDESSDNDGDEFVDELDEYDDTVVLDDESTVIPDEESADLLDSDDTAKESEEVIIDENDESDIPDFELANADIFDTDEETSSDTDTDTDSDTGVYCRYFDRDNQGEMVEVDQADASGREFVYIDENSGKLSRICGIIKNEPASNEDSIF